MEGIITYKNMKQFETIFKNLKKEGYDWINGENITFEAIRDKLPKQAKIFAIHFFYNNITKKKELQFQTLNFYKNNKQLRHLINK